MSSPIPTFSTWWQAARPRTLPAAAAPVLVALALAWRDDVFHPLAGPACLLVSLLMQIGANFANDLFDHERGTDTPDRLGPVRATASGMVTPAQMRLATALVFALAVLPGLYIVFLRGWPVVIFGVLIILAALAYTGGPFPYGYHAMGDVFVLLSFGFAAVCGTYYAQSGMVTWPAIAVALPPGLLIVNILVVNNTRDIETDRAANKRTLAVALGRRAMQVEYLVCLGAAYLIPLGMIALGWAGWPVALTLLSLPRAWSVYRQFCQAEGRALNPILAATAQVALFHAVLFAIGLLF